MSDPFSLRKIPPEVLQLAHALSAQTGLSINDVFRLALASGILVEVTRVAPRSDGTFAGLPGVQLARSLRRHLGSAIDLLIEYDQHPYQKFVSESKQEHVSPSSGGRSLPPADLRPERSIEEDLDMLGIGAGLSETLENQE